MLPVGGIHECPDNVFVCCTFFGRFVNRPYGTGRCGHRPLQIYTYFTKAIVSTSTNTSLGSCFAATHERAGLLVKYSA